MIKTIETNNLILRPISHKDLDGMFALDSDAEVHRYLGNEPIKTKEEAGQMIDYILAQYDLYGIGRWAVIDKATGEFVGWSGLKYETELREECGYYDIGYRFRRPYWGKGIATETAIASLRFGFEELHLPEICAAADQENLASNHILQKIGLRPSGTFLYSGVTLNWYRLGLGEYLDRE